MNIFTSRIIIAIIAVIFTIGSGIWLSKMGRPLNVILFNLHKLVSLAAIVFIVLGLIQLLNTVQADNLLIVLYVLTGLALVSTLATGGLLSFDKFGVPSIVLIHKISSILILVLSGLSLYFLSTANIVDQL